jgi:hypothetical protein
MLEVRKGRKRKLTPIEERLVYEQRKEGKSVTEVAYFNGISTKTVQRTVNRMKQLEEEGKDEQLKVEGVE